MQAEEDPPGTALNPCASTTCASGKVCATGSVAVPGRNLILFWDEQVWQLATQSSLPL